MHPEPYPVEIKGLTPDQKTRLKQLYIKYGIASEIKEDGNTLIVYFKDERSKRKGWIIFRKIILGEEDDENCTKQKQH